MSPQQGGTVYVDPVVVGPIVLEEARGVIHTTLRLAVYWQVGQLNTIYKGSKI